MVQRKRMGFSGLVVGASVMLLFVVTDALDITWNSTSEQAESPVASADREKSCHALRDVAKGVMQARQAGAARDVVAGVLEPLGDDGVMMLALAYGYPVHDALESKEQAVVEFAEGIHTKCSSVAAQ